MKNFWATTGVLVVIGLAVALACYRWHCDEPLHAAARQRDALAWLTTEYHLAPEQAAAIGRLHAAYANIMSGCATASLPSVVVGTV